MHEGYREFSVNLRKTERDHGWGTVNRNFESEELQEGQSDAKEERLREMK